MKRGDQKNRSYAENGKNRQKIEMKRLNRDKYRESQDQLYSTVLFFLEFAAKSTRRLGQKKSMFISAWCSTGCLSSYCGPEGEVMKDLGQHIRIRTKNDCVIAPTAEEKRKLARIVLTIAKDYSLLSFGLADTHLHLQVVASRASCGMLSRRLLNSLRQQLELPSPFEPTYFLSIRDGKHNYNTFRYILNQQHHHGVHTDPLHEASNLPDLLGLRNIGAFSIGHVRRFLPRVSRKMLLDLMGTSDLQPKEGSTEYILEAAKRASALSDLSGSSAPALETRRAIVHILRKTVSNRRIAEFLGVSRRTVLLHAKAAPNLKLITAIEKQMDLTAKKQKAIARSVLL